MDPRAFLTLAENLAVGAGAAEYQTAINRAYYAAFGFAVDVLAEVGMAIPRTAQAHGYVRELLQNCPGADLQQARKNLADLYALRERADYEMRDAAIETPQPAARAVGIARRVITTLERVAS